MSIAHAVRCDSAILDGEIVCLDEDGRPNFHKLLFRREWPFFYAFNVIELDRMDLRKVPLIHRKRLLKVIMPIVESRVRYVDHFAEKGTDFYRLACEHDFEGIVAKWKRDTYRAQRHVMTKHLASLIVFCVCISGSGYAQRSGESSGDLTPQSLLVIGKASGACGILNLQLQFQDNTRSKVVTSSSSASGRQKPHGSG